MSTEVLKTEPDSPNVKIPWYKKLGGWLAKYVPQAVSIYLASRRKT